MMKQRDKSIDLMKSILVVQMIIAHITFFFSRKGQMSLLGIYTNLVAFSGFMFAIKLILLRVMLILESI